MRPAGRGEGEDGGRDGRGHAPASVFSFCKGVRCSSSFVAALAAEPSSSGRASASSRGDSRSSAFFRAISFATWFDMVRQTRRAR